MQYNFVKLGETLKGEEYLFFFFAFNCLPPNLHTKDRHQPDSLGLIWELFVTSL